MTQAKIIVPIKTNLMRHLTLEFMARESDTAK